MKEAVVINASPLIFLAKLDMLHLLEMYSCFTTREVIDEVLSGLEKGSKEGLLVKSLVEGGNLGLTEVAGDAGKGEELGLHEGELSVIMAAKKLRARVVVDDYAAIKVARYFGLRPISTPFVLLEALRNKVLTKRQARAALENLVSHNYWISPSLYARILAKIEKI